MHLYTHRYPHAFSEGDRKKKSRKTVGLKLYVARPNASIERNDTPIDVLERVESVSRSPQDFLANRAARQGCQELILGHSAIPDEERSTEEEWRSARALRCNLPPRWLRRRRSCAPTDSVGR